jgi:hypothetical protein
MKANVHSVGTRNGVLELIAVVRLTDDDRRAIAAVHAGEGEFAEPSVCLRYVRGLFERHEPGAPSGLRMARLLRTLLEGFAPADPASDEYNEAEDGALLASIDDAETPDFLLSIGAEARAALDEWIAYYGPLDQPMQSITCPECGDPAGVEIGARRCLVLCGCALPESVLATLTAGAQPEP